MLLTPRGDAQTSLFHGFCGHVEVGNKPDFVRTKGKARDAQVRQFANDLSGDGVGQREDHDVGFDWVDGLNVGVCGQGLAQQRGMGVVLLHARCVVVEGVKSRRGENACLPHAAPKNFA